VRQDNALRRLAPLAEALGALTGAESRRVDQRICDEDRALTLAVTTSISPSQAEPVLARAGGAAGAPLTHSVKVIDVARRQGVTLAELLAAAGVAEELESGALVTADLELKYAGYFERERLQADRMRRMGEFALQSDLPYEEMRSLAIESRQKLARIRPATLAQASRIPGVNPSDLQNLVMEIEKRRRMAQGAGGDDSARVPVEQEVAGE
jgi:tRNA uridine 5-carboxymethylaminomethyl modification enzyme